VPDSPFWRSPWRVAAVAAVVLAAAGILVYVQDTAPVRAMDSAITNHTTAVQLADLRRDIAGDHARLLDCHDILRTLDTPNPQLSTQWRACIVQGLRSVQSPQGAINFLMPALGWLKTHPHDEEVRKASADAIDASWTSLAYLMQPVYLPIEQLQEARRRSFFTVNRPVYGDVATFEQLGNRLDQLEMAILLPELDAWQAQRRLIARMWKPQVKKP
jgi:hypothetical protein